MESSKVVAKKKIRTECVDVAPSSKKKFLKNSITKEILERETKKALVEAKKQLASIVSKKSDPLRALNEISRIIGDVLEKAHLFSQVYPDKSIRGAAEKSIEKLSRFSTELYLRSDVFQILQGVRRDTLHGATKRFLDKELLDFRLSGVDKPPLVRKKIAGLMKQMVKLGQFFDRNINNDIRHIEIPEKEMEGLPEDYRKNHRPNSRGVVKITTQYPDCVPFMQYAKSSEARHKLYLKNNNRGWPKNDFVFRKLLGVRKQVATLLGYPDWATYITINKMARSPKLIHQFLNEIDRLTKQRSEKDYAILLKLKRQDDLNAKKIEPWELGYYDNLAIKKVIGLDAKEIRNYFPFEETKNGILKSAEQLFKLSFKKVLVSRWHKDVEVYNVYRKQELIGRFYLDLHPRENKYNHAACFGIRSGLKGVQLPEAALVCNFSRELMDHSEVVTFFHEFGHLMHFILAGQQEWTRMSGISAEWDFVEAPSQMLESWAFDYETLKPFARHIKTKKIISREIVQKLEQSEDFGKGIWQRRQLFLAALSLEYHQVNIKTNEDLVYVLKKVQNKYSNFAYIPSTHMYASFGHLNGYSAIYYTYLWSRAIAEDILEPFRKNGMYHKKTASRYISSILKKGGSEDAGDMLKEFLGRDWNLEAFRRWLNK